LDGLVLNILKIIDICQSDEKPIVMNKKKEEPLKDLSDLRNIFGLEKDFQPESNEKQIHQADTPTAHALKSNVRIHLQRLKGNKEATLIKGIEDTEEALKILCSDLKKHCGVGGSTKEETILLQGNHRQKVADFLIAKGFKNTKLAGG